MTTNELKLRAGDWVEVRSKEEILRTLDRGGRLDGMPFMPEMFEFCGRKFQVQKRAHKSCDPDYRSRRIERAVHLETRCDGQAHGGCQAGCTFFWKEAWLRPASRNGNSPARPELINVQSTAGECTEKAVWDNVKAPGADGAETSYVCQTTQVQHEQPLKWWDLRQYLEDYWSGNINLRRLFTGMGYSAYYHLSQARGRLLESPLRWLYNVVRPLGPGIAWPRTPGVLPAGQSTPADDLNLQPGELVRVKSQEQILRTVNSKNLNRGMYWDAELVPYCGGTFRVLKRVTQVLDERTGKMQVMKTPAIILDSVVCGARYSDCRMFCPRATYAYWREIWLERVSPEGAAPK